jgi:hypothetical protein
MGSGEENEGETVNPQLQFRARIFWALVVAGLCIGWVIA